MIRKILLFVSTLLLFISCDKTSEIQIQQGIGAVSLSFSNENISKKLANDAIPNAILLTIVDANGENVINNRKLTLTSFGSSYITEDIELIQGDYAITSFNIVDEDNVVIYSSPLENSELADLVDDPLPINFSVIEGETNTVSPEVIFVGPTATPEQFGYTSFSFTIVDVPTDSETQDLYISITEVIDGASNEFVDGEFLIEIPTQDFTLEGQIFVDHIPITIPATEDNEEIKITVIYKDYENQIFTIDAAQIADFSEQDPFEVLFETVTSNPD